MSHTYQDSQFQAFASNGVGAGATVVKRVRKTTVASATKPGTDWTAQADQLLKIFNDDSKPAHNGKFGTFLY